VASAPARAGPDEALGQPRIPDLPYRVREVSARTALQKCSHPAIPWSLNPYQGCAHACSFCYVPTLIHVDRVEWGRYVLVKRNAPTLLAREVRRLPRALVALSTATDPYQPVEARCLVTRRCLEVLAQAQWPVSVLTRSPLVLRDLDVLRRFRGVEVGMSVPTLDEAARRFMEPGAPTIEARLRCLRALADAGLSTFVSLAPVYPLTNGVTAEGFAQALADAGVRDVFIGGYRHYGNSWEHMLPRIQASGIANLGRFADRAYIRAVTEDLLAELRARGVGAGGKASRADQPGSAFAPEARAEVGGGA
jgi:DNA repair photolyase